LSPETITNTTQSPSAEGLTRRVALVTGASHGVGRAIAETLIEAGARVFGAALYDPGIDGLDCQVQDLRTREGCEALVARAVDQAGGIDCIVNNVGGLAAPRLAGVASVSDEEWAVTMDLNLFSAVRVIRAALAHGRLIERGGRIVNISSVAAITPEPSTVDYSAAKAGLNAYTKALASELAPQGVRVNTVSLGAFKTPAWMADGALGDQLAAAMGMDRDQAIDTMLAGFGGVGLNRWGRTEEAAAAVRFLLSDQSSYITGATLYVDGGMHKSL
jgi:putative oxidoreductase